MFIIITPFILSLISRYTCYEMYHSMPTGLSPEYVTFVDEKGMSAGVSGRTYLLRPEVIESLYILFTVTKDPLYQ